MSKNTFEAVCIMFEEIKDKLESLTEPNSGKNNDIVSDIDKLIKNIKTPKPDTKQLEDIAYGTRNEIKNVVKRIENIVQKSEEDKVVSHIHSIEIKSIKVCVALFVLVVALLVLLFFNFS